MERMVVVIEKGGFYDRADARSAGSLVQISDCGWPSSFVCWLKLTVVANASVDGMYRI
jgi:hypothetical protein